MRQLIPFLQASGYTVTDLTQPGWLATEENINILISKMSELKIDPDFSVVLDLFSNCSHRYENFDGTQSLPFKEAGKYHMAGPVVPCADHTFKRIVKMLSPVLLSAQNAKKIVIPPLPWYVFNPCCSGKNHCTNFTEDNYAVKSLDGTTKLRAVLKKELANIGMKNYWIIDGTGSLIGTPPGENPGSNSKIVGDLRKFLANDGVHLTPAGNKNVATNIISALAGIGKTLPKCDDTAGISCPGSRKSREFFWRGYTSPVGDAVGRSVPQKSGKYAAGPVSRNSRKDVRPYDRSWRSGPNRGSHAK
jgi:hypothetical protein